MNESDTDGRVRPPPPRHGNGLGACLRRHPADTPTEEPVPGRLGGEPDWLQGDETPDCPHRAGHMTFVAELADGRDFATSANFGGGGRGYVFGCHPCGEAAFLWQR